MMIRKTGLFLLIVVPAVVLVWVYLARNAIVTGVATYSLQKMLGTPVQMQGVDLDPFAMRATFQRLRIQGRDDPKSWLLVAGPARFDLNGAQLFARKFVVDELRVDGLGFGVPCPDCKPPPPAPPPPPSQAAPPATEGKGGGWSLHIPLPELNLEALKQELDVERITSGQKLGSLQALDQAQTDGKARIAGLQQRYERLATQARLDAIEKQVNALDFKSKDPRKLKEALDGLKDASAKAKALQSETQALVRDVRAEPGHVKADFARVDQELDADVAAASRLAHLGGLNAGQVGELVFGKVVLERFNWVLAQFRRVRGMLSSDEQPVQKPTRGAGRLISYPVTGRAYPGFLVDTIAFSGSGVDAAGGETLRYTGQLTGLSSDARVYGKPMLLDATAAGKSGENWVVRGSFDHRTSPGQDQIAAQGHGVRLGDVKLSGGSLPERATSRDADVNLQATLRGFAVAAALRIDANQVQFVFAQGAADNATQRNIRELFAGFDSVQLEATLGGTLTQPKVHISSSIDEQFSKRLQSLVGKRQAEAQAKIRTQISQRVEAQRALVRKALDDQLSPLQAQVQAAQQKVRALQEQLARRQAEVEAAAKGKAASKVEDLKARLRRR